MDESKMTMCKACGYKIAKDAKKCINCGKDQRNFFMKHIIIIGILSWLILTIFASIAIMAALTN